jgi:hypothetical protein
MSRPYLPICVLDNGLDFGHSAPMTVSRNRRSLLVVLAALPLGLAVRPANVSAACMTGALPSATVSGVVVSTSIAPSFGVMVAVRTDDGVTREVGFWGRNPTNTFEGGVENTVEDAWPGSLPQVGGRYKITGDFNGEGQPITVNNCAQSPSVEVLSAPPASTTTEVTTAVTTDGGISTSAVVVLVIAVGVLLAAVALVVRRRSHGERA